MVKGNESIVKALNEALSNELGAIIQWNTHAHMLLHWGFNRLAAYYFHAEKDESDHKGQLIKRILFLEGTPTMNPNSRELGTDIIEILKLDLKGEKHGIETLGMGIKLAEEKCDFVTRELFMSILKEEAEDHTKWLEEQLNLINSLGVENYLTAQM